MNGDARERLVIQNWWFTSSVVKGHKYCPPLTKAIRCDMLIVGGGFSGVVQRQSFFARD